MKVYEFKITDHNYCEDPYIELYKSPPTIEDMERFIQEEFHDEHDLLLSLNEVVINGYAQFENYDLEIKIIEVVENGN